MTPKTWQERGVENHKKIVGRHLWAFPNRSGHALAACLFVIRQPQFVTEEILYSIMTDSRQGSQAKPLYYIVFLIPRLALSSHQHRNLVCPAVPQGVRLYLAKQNMAAAAAAARRTAMKVLPSPALLLSILVKRLYCAHSPTNPTTACQEGFQLLHTMQNSFFKWTKLLNLEMTIFGLK